MSEMPGRAEDTAAVPEVALFPGWAAEGQTPLREWTPVDTDTLRSVSLAFASGESLEAVCEHLVGRLISLLTADAGAIFLLESEDWARPVASMGMTEAMVVSVEGPAAWAIRSGQPVRLAGGSSGDSLCIPVMLEDTVLAAFVATRSKSLEPFVERDLALALSLASQLALSIERAQVQERLGREQVKTNLIQRQLEVYAEDFSSTFAAEKQRSAQLAAALAKLEQTYLATVRSLAVAVEAKDEYTAGHLSRVTGYGLAILRTVAPEQYRDPKFTYGFLLHDVGKMAIPDEILKKSGPLNDSEWKVMRQHPHTGRRILAGVPFLGSATDIVFAHHERWDGRGYPNGLMGRSIPLGARIFAVADSYDAMTTDRPYRSAMSHEAAVFELRANSGSQFWPDAVEAFLAIPRHALEDAAQLPERLEL